ncbi:protein NRT1/ PTR FAMILY 1.2-like [Carica papaya]|uniref:protein NRT1/ PTR FAMILY 1.2-like n=1 Tax=Carica papaya TaxID=3649 RepID=UPI000B8CD3CA|nr:protein NRT1/ PTR FAMILY 1.2-like [Carica papaya]
METVPTKTDDQQSSSKKKGGLRTMPFIIVNETFEKVASFGLHANMILYLKNEYHMSNAAGANVLFLWLAISNLTPTFGAFFSDSYLGRFRVIALASLVTFMGMSTLFLTAVIPQARPPYCDVQLEEICKSARPPHLALLFLSFGLMAIGAGGVRPCSLAFGADQLDKPENPNNARILQSFFNWYYASVGISVMISVTVIVYIQDKAGWAVGFGVPVVLMFLSVAMFLLGSSLYVKVKPNRSLFTGFVQVISATWKNRHLALPPTISNGICYYQGDSINLLVPSDKLRVLNKACIIKNPEKELDADGFAVAQWSLCSVKQVEELKALIKVLPIWSTGIMIAVTISQHSFPVLQATTMDRRLVAGFKIPAGSFSLFAIITLTIWVAIYDRVLVPFISKFTKRPRGLSFKQRMGIGLVISCLSTSTAALVERNRRAAALKQGLANNPLGLVNMSAMWLAPQYCLSGLAEAFNAIGQIEFYYSQFPKSMSSIAVSLFSLSMAMGNLVGSVIVGVLNHVTHNPSWVTNNLNQGHYDYYYCVLTVLCGINFLYYLICSWAYGPCEGEQICDKDKAHH